jgi:ATP-dependent Zn protease
MFSSTPRRYLCCALRTLVTCSSHVFLHVFFFATCKKNAHCSENITCFTVINHFAGISAVFHDSSTQGGVTYILLSIWSGLKHARINIITHESDVASTGAAESLLGQTEAAPLHVKLQSFPSSQPNPLLSALRGVVSFFLTLVVIMVLWVIGAAAEGSLQLRGGLGGNGQTMTDKPGSPNAPKEYSRENIPESSVKTFADVKGCEEAKAELQVLHNSRLS